MTKMDIKIFLYFGIFRKLIAETIGIKTINNKKSGNLVIRKSQPIVRIPRVKPMAIFLMFIEIKKFNF